MALRLIKENGGRIIEVLFSEKLSKISHKQFIPEVQRSGYVIDFECGI